MENKTFIKTLIVSLRNSGKSFQEISNILKEEYGIERSRQAICGMYNRAIGDSSITKNINETLATHDILNYSALGISKDRIAEILKADGYDMSSYKVNNILSNNKNKLSSIQKQKENTVYKLMKEGHTGEYIQDVLKYKVEYPTKAALATMLQHSLVKLLNEVKIDTLGKVLRQTQDKDLIKVVISLDGDVTFKDVAKAAKKQEYVGG